MNLHDMAQRRNGHPPAVTEIDVDDDVLPPDPSDPDPIPILPAMTVPEVKPVQLDIQTIAQAIADGITNPNARCWPDGNTLNIERVVSRGGQKFREQISITFATAKRRSFPLVSVK